MRGKSKSNSLKSFESLKVCQSLKSETVCELLTQDGTLRPAIYMHTHVRTYSRCIGCIRYSVDIVETLDILDTLETLHTLDL